MITVPEYFGCNVFDDRKMHSYLSDEIYETLKKTIEVGESLDLATANAVAKAMKKWAVENGATHFTHWFQPMTGITAEKHDSFIELSQDGGVIMDFSGKELVKGEPDASSFPSGGLRATFEARGYTAWDPTSFAFIKGKVLHIPTAFCSFRGEALDKKTPLLRSMDVLNREALRLFRILGDTEVKRVNAVVGAEQEYFLIPEELYEKRTDLKYAGRTLFGSPAPKGQELDDHYFGAIKPGVTAFMEDLNESLWKLGIAAKTEHNEVAPSQHELACIYNTVNVATDQNQLVMEVMKETARRHGMICLLHEKPFAGVNGSGKHINWSLATDTGLNLLSPGSAPFSNHRFLLFLCAVLKAVDDYQDLLRLSVATASNDHRLGGNEAPPAVISVFLGDELAGILDAVERGIPYDATYADAMSLGSEVIPQIRKDHTDRNRTSPFAFTGNKFEFRMPGASASIAGPNTVLNSAVADSLRLFADELEGADDMDRAVSALVRRTYSEHRRIVFNGNGYEDEWLDEAEKRGLFNGRTTPDCLLHLMDEKNVNMLSGLGVYTATELASRCMILFENYYKAVRIEARTMASMAISQIAPSVEKYAADLAERAAVKKGFAPEILCEFEEKLVRHLSALTDEILKSAEDLTGILSEETGDDWADLSGDARDRLIPAMVVLRGYCDEAEKWTAKEYWPIPTYGELMFGTK